MNTIVTSKEEILKTSRALIQEQGWSETAWFVTCITLAVFSIVGRLYLQLF